MCVWFLEIAACLMTCAGIRLQPSSDHPIRTVYGVGCCVRALTSYGGDESRVETNSQAELVLSELRAVKGHDIIRLPKQMKAGR
jgi:hypothetical protein